MMFLRTSLFTAAFLVGSALSVADPASAQLRLEETDDQIIVSFAGSTAEPGQPAIPSWKAILLREDAGNISALHVPADSPLDLSSRRGGWPITVVSTRCAAGVNDPDKGRDNYAKFRVETMGVVSRSDEQVVIRVAGPSRRQHSYQDRTYTFTPRGVAIEGTVTALVDLKRAAWDPHWDRDQMADSHELVTPVRTQGRHGWVIAPSSGSDAVTPLPEFVNFPLEAELKLRRDRPTFLRLFIDQPFTTTAEKRMMVNNNKDFEALPSQRMYYEKLVGGIESAPLKVGQSDRFKVRYEFEVR